MILNMMPGVHIDEDELIWRYACASGPGGQNVNKVATAVRLRFDVAHATGLPEPVRRRLVHLAGSRMTAEGVLLIEAGRFRSRERNKQDALERLAGLIRSASVQPKSRRKTQPSRSAKQRRLNEKARRGGLKRLRGSRPDHD